MYLRSGLTLKNQYARKLGSIERKPTNYKSANLKKDWACNSQILKALDLLKIRKATNKLFKSAKFADFVICGPTTSDTDDLVQVNPRR
jgi:hypothetical protein